MTWFFVLLMVAMIAAFAYVGLTQTSQRRACYLRRYEFPPSTIDRFQQHYPQLDAGQVDQVVQGLRRFFVYYQKSGYQHLVPPSQLVATLWYSFAQDRRPYRQFCQRAFGKYSHPQPAAMFGEDHQQNRALSLTWVLSCRYEVINPRTPTILPILFALDVMLGIEGGLVYRLDSSGLYSASLGIGADREAMNGAVQEVYCHHLATLEVDYEHYKYSDPQ